jgi:hypothetical protein
MLLATVTWFTLCDAVAADLWLVRSSSVMTSNKKRACQGLALEAEPEAFSRSFWADKAIRETEYLSRLGYIR